MDNKQLTKVLVVEDENIIAKDIQNRLKRLGYKVTALASSGAEAIRKAEETRPDLVLMDIVLKGDMDGVEAARQIHARFNIPVVYLTAYADENTLQRAKITEPFGYILKPFEERGLHTIIEITLYKHNIERKLKKSEQWLATTLKSIGDAVIATDKEGFVTFMNPVAGALTGWKQEDALGKNLGEIFNTIDKGRRTLTESLATKALREGVVVGVASHTFIAMDGRETPIDVSAAPIKDDKGNTTGVVLVFRDITERKQAEEKLRYMSMHDVLTGLYNRTYFQEEMARLERGRQFPVSVVMADVDGLKATNDSQGHTAGDELLRRAAAVLRAAFRTEDVVARIGGDEFAVLLPRADATTVEKALARLRNSLLAHNTTHSGLFLNFCLGAATVEKGGSLAEALNQADKRMYREKLSRRG